jgi:hypothetical protein
MILPLPVPPVFDPPLPPSTPPFPEAGARYILVRSASHNFGQEQVSVNGPPGYNFPVDGCILGFSQDTTPEWMLLDYVTNARGQGVS